VRRRSSIPGQLPSRFRPPNNSDDSSTRTSWRASTGGPNGCRDPSSLPRCHISDHVAGFDPVVPPRHAFAPEPRGRPMTDVDKQGLNTRTFLRLSPYAWKARTGGTPRSFKCCARIAQRERRQMRALGRMPVSTLSPCSRRIALLRRGILSNSGRVRTLATGPLRTNR